MADGTPAERVAVVGATGLVGETLCAVLAERGHGAAVAALAAGDESVGRELACGERRLRCMAVDAALGSLQRGDLAYLCTDAATSRALAPELAVRGVRAVDLSSAFRLDPKVPLLVPELLDDSRRREAATTPLVASPNCSATMLVVALWPLRLAFGIDHVQVATYQAMSGAGRRAVAALRAQTLAALTGQTPDADSCWQHRRLAFEVFPHESALDAFGDNEEEHKLVAETRRLLASPSLPIDPTCARVPVLSAHCQAVTVTLQQPVDAVRAISLLDMAPSVRVVHDPAAATAGAASGGDDVLVSRIRGAPSERHLPVNRRRRLMLWLCADQLRKGAATNAVQIAEALGWLGGGA